MANKINIWFDEVVKRGEEAIKRKKLEMADLEDDTEEVDDYDNYYSKDS